MNSKVYTGAIALITILMAFVFPGIQMSARDMSASLVTCYPGPEIYELCGHEAIRISGTDENGEEVDSVWNYGLFDFAEPNFVYRFVKGETDYMVAGYPFNWFLPEYIARGSKVVEQRLNLTPEEVKALRKRLQTVALPQNRKYRYNYVRNNCATRIVDDVEAAVNNRIIYSDTLNYGTFREEMRAYHKKYPWYQFGIDLALGSGLDRPVSSREEMFVPVEMQKRFATAHFADGSPVVASTVILNQGVADATLPATSPFLSPMSVALLVFLLTVALAIWGVWKHRFAMWWYSFYFLVCGLGGCVIAFLVFVSEHEATSPNLLIFWLNPLQLLTAVLPWWRRTRWPAVIMAWANIVVVGSLLVIWPFQHQSGNPAFFPLMGSAVVLGIAYAINWSKDSLNKKGSRPTGAKRQPRQASRRRTSGRK